MDKGPKRRREGHLTPLQGLSRLWPYVKPDLAVLGVGFGALTIASYSNANTPALMRAVVDTSSTKSCQSDEQKRLLIRALSTFVAGSVGSCVRTMCFSAVSSSVGRRLREAIFGNLIQQELLYFLSNVEGEASAATIVDSINNDVEEVTSAITTTAGNMIRYTSSVVSGLFLLVRVTRKPIVSLIGMTIVTMVTGTSFWLNKRLSRARKESERVRIQTTNFVSEKVSAIATVRAFARESHETKRFNELALESQRNRIRVGRAEGFFFAALDLSVKALGIGGVAFGSTLVQRGELTAGELSASTMYAVLFGMGLAGWARVMTNDWTTPASRIFGYIQRLPKQPLVGGITPERLNGEIVLESVAFTYPNRPNDPIIEDVDLKILPGQTITLAGASGCGKSTIGKLLLRLYEPSAGQILFDGVPAQDMDPSWLRHQIGVVEQESPLFSGTIADNIRYGKLGATQDEIERAAKLANAHDFIVAQSKGYETDVGERGQLLSGGQRQRIAIARALVKDPPILILDEATASLDQEAEAVVHDALNNAMNGRTVLIFAHNEANLGVADKVGLVGPKSGDPCDPSTLLRFGSRKEVGI